MRGTVWDWGGLGGGLYENGLKSIYTYKQHFMENTHYKALIIEQTGEKQYSRRIGEKKVSELPAGEVIVKVAYSALNYKDALSAAGNKGVTRNYPHTPGIDASGIVAETADSRFAPGDEVVVTSYDLGMDTPGGFGQYIRVPAEWVVKMPAGLSLKESMVLGTAGFTVGMAVYKMSPYLKNEGEILVTGASGGVGCMAVGILSKLGYAVAAVTGKPEAHEFLRNAGASRIISREELLENSGKPVLKAQWAGVTDVVGGEMLSAAIKGLKPGGVAAICGLVASPEFQINVFPFILRGITVVGVDSERFPQPQRTEIWNKLADEWKPIALNNLYTEVSLDQLDAKIDEILKGKITGRILVNMEGEGV